MINLSLIWYPQVSICVPCTTSGLTWWEAWLRHGTAGYCWCYSNVHEFNISMYGIVAIGDAQQRFRHAPSAPLNQQVVPVTHQLRHPLYTVAPPGADPGRPSGSHRWASLVALGEAPPWHPVLGPAKRSSLQLLSNQVIHRRWLDGGGCGFGHWSHLTMRQMHG